MTEGGGSLDPVSRRILLALDAAAMDAPVWEVAAALAAELQARLEGVFVEDADLFRLAGLPFSCELDYVSAAVRPLEPAEILRMLRSRASRARLALEQSAARTRVSWSFQVIRGEIVRDMLAAASDVDLLILSCGGGQRREVALGRRTPGRESKAAPVMVVCDGSATDEHVLDVAAQLSHASRQKLVVMLAPPAGTNADSLQAQIARQLAERKMEYTLQASPVADVSQLLAAHRKWNSGWLVISRGSPLLDEVHLRRLACQIARPIVLVGR